MVRSPARRRSRNYRNVAAKKNHYQILRTAIPDSVDSARHLAPDGSDNGALRKEAENKIKEEVDKKFALGERFALRFTDKNIASEYLRADPGHAKGSLNLPSTVPMIWHIARIV
jgi:hypothetical protein